MQGSIGQNDREENGNTGKNIEEILHITSTTESNLHMSSTPEVPVESSLNNEALKIAHKAKIIFSSIRDVLGDYADRLLDTRIKDKPTIRDLKNINERNLRAEEPGSDIPYSLPVRVPVDG